MADRRFVGLQRAGRRSRRVRVIVRGGAGGCLLGLAHRELAGIVIGCAIAVGRITAVTAVVIGAEAKPFERTGVARVEVAGIGSSGIEGSRIDLARSLGGVSLGIVGVVIGSVAIIGVVDLAGHVRIIGVVDLVGHVRIMGFAGVAVAGGIGAGQELGVANRRRALRLDRRGVDPRDEGDEHEQDHQEEPGEPPSGAVA